MLGKSPAEADTEDEEDDEGGAAPTSTAAAQELQRVTRAVKYVRVFLSRVPNVVCFLFVFSVMCFFFFHYRNPGHVYCVCMMFCSIVTVVFF